MMNLTSVIILVSALHVSANTFSQKVSVKAENLSLVKVFKIITKQTGFQFVYTKDILENSKPVTVELKNVELRTALEKCLDRQMLDFEITPDKIIVITPAESLNSQLTIAGFVAPPVTGVIRNADGNPLAAVNIVVKGTKRGTVTDASGRFSIEAKVNEVLVVSSIGYNTKEVKISSLDGLPLIVLEQNLSPLDEVQIIAYGKTTQRFSTGNISSVKAKDIEKQPVGNPLLALQGRVPGLMIVQSTGLPGSGVKVSIQGVNSINNGNDPFYVIDGVPYPSQTISSINTVLGNSGSVGMFGGSDGNPLSYLNPGDIESMEVLKDADATAIYGSRAANGAILITTKRAKSGATKIDLDVQQGFGKIPKKIELMNTQQYLAMRKEAIKNDGLQIPSQPAANFYDLTLYDQNRYTDWQKVLLGNTAGYTNAQANISGGTSNVQALFGVNYHNESTVFPGEYHDEKVNFHFNISGSSLNKKFNFRASGTYLIDINKLPGTDLTQKALSLIPNAPVLYDSTGKLNWEPYNGSVTWANPLAPNLVKSIRKNTVFMGGMNFSYELLEGFSLKADIGYNSMIGDEKLYTPQLAVDPLFWPFANFRNASLDNASQISWILEPQLMYNKKTEIGKFDIVVGATFNRRNNRTLRVSASGFSDDSQIETISLATSYNSTENASVYNYNALFGRLGYNYHDTYLLNISARRDGSSRFGVENLFHDFYSVGAGWIFTNTKLFRHTQKVLSFGKLKFSYGTSGNDQIGDYRFLSAYNPYTMPVLYGGGNGLMPSGLSNPYLQWEETKKINAGLEFSFLNDRLLFNTNYYRNRSSNQLVDKTLPEITGFYSIAQNFNAVVQNSGLEIAINTKNITATHFQWTSNFTISFNRNKLLSYKNFETSEDRNRLILGEPLTIVKVFSFAGVDPETGMYQFRTSDGKLSSEPVDPLDRNVVVNPVPKYFGSLNNSFVYKQFSLDIDLRFVNQVGLDISRFGTLPGAFYSLSNRGNQPVNVINSWKNKGDNARVQKMTTQSNFSWFYANEGGYVDASFVRLNNVALSWFLPGKWLAKTHFQKAKLYFHGQNLLTFTSYKGLNPEVPTAFFALPPLRIMTIGLNVTL